MHSHIYIPFSIMMNFMSPSNSNDVIFSEVFICNHLVLYSFMSL